MDLRRWMLRNLEVSSMAPGTVTPAAVYVQQEHARTQHSDLNPKL